MPEKYSIQPEHPGEYLDKKLDLTPITAEERESLDHNVESADFEVDEEKYSADGYMERRDHLHGYNIAYRIGLVKPEDYPPNVADYINFVERVEHRDLKYVQLSDLVISQNSNSMVDMTSINPAGYTVILDVNRAEGAICDNKRKIISLPWFNNPEHIIELFHESAHAEIFESLSEEEQKEYMQISSMARYQRLGRGATTILASNLKNERDAWALAIRRMKSLIGRKEGEGIITKKDLLVTIHKLALNHHSREAARRLGRQLETEIKD